MMIVMSVPSLILFQNAIQNRENQHVFELYQNMKRLAKLNASSQLQSNHVSNQGIKCIYPYSYLYPYAYIYIYIYINKNVYIFIYLILKIKKIILEHVQ